MACRLASGICFSHEKQSALMARHRPTRFDKNPTASSDNPEVDPTVDRIFRSNAIYLIPFNAPHLDAIAGLRLMAGKLCGPKTGPMYGHRHPRRVPDPAVGTKEKNPRSKSDRGFRHGSIDSTTHYGRFLSSVSASCGVELACANTVVADWARICARVRLLVSAAKLVS